MRNNSEMWAIVLKELPTQNYYSICHAIKECGFDFSEQEQLEDDLIDTLEEAKGTIGYINKFEDHRDEVLIGYWWSVEDLDSRVTHVEYLIKKAKEHEQKTP